jgi:hypothetical protein
MTEGETKWKKVEKIKKRKWNKGEAKQNKRPGPGHLVASATREYAPPPPAVGHHAARATPVRRRRVRTIQNLRARDSRAGSPTGAATWTRRPPRPGARASVGGEKKHHAYPVVRAWPQGLVALGWPADGRFCFGPARHVFPTRGACASVVSHGRLANVYACCQSSLGPC